MKSHNINTVFNIILLISTVSLFFYIKWYFSTLSGNVKNRLSTNQILFTVAMGLVVSMVIASENVPLLNRCMFFLASVFIHAGTCYLMLNAFNQKERIFSKSYIIFQNGQFFKGVMLESKLSEKDILATLKIKGISDLSIIESVILEPDGELTIIYKEKVTTA